MGLSAPFQRVALIHAWMRGQKKPPYNGVPAENRGIA
jgi:hypothetical protein